MTLYKLQENSICETTEHGTCNQEKMPNIKLFVICVLLHTIEDTTHATAQHKRQQNYPSSKQATTPKQTIDEMAI